METKTTQRDLIWAVGMIVWAILWAGNKYAEGMAWVVMTILVLLIF